MLPPKVPLSTTDQRIMEEAMASFVIYAPFFSYYFYDKMEMWPTRAIQTLATDAKRIFVNPAYFGTLKPTERAFALAHEVYHVIYKHPIRMRHYLQAGEVKGLPFMQDLFNTAADYVINADLVDSKIGTCNPAWLYDPTIKASELAEDVYVKLYKKLPPPQGGQQGPQPQQPQGGQEQGDSQQPTTGSGGAEGDDEGQQPTTGSGKPQLPKPSTYGEATGKKGGDRDKQAQANNGRFDEVLPPERDGQGVDDLPHEVEFREAIARAEQAAKRAGKLPANIKRMIDEILQPQVNWREHIRIVLTGKVGNRRETWDHPNRRRIVLNPMVYMPGRRGYGAELVVCVVDNSGSVSEKELSACFAEVGGVLNDCKPKRVMLMWCDAKVHRVDEARSLDELSHIRQEGSPGGGGTSFRPPFEYLAERNIRPDTMIYLTDMYPNDGWPEEPKYPVIWCATTETKGPWGDTVRITV
jgi:predicted metal-dependent peptidase